MDMPTSALPIAVPTGAPLGRHECESCPMARVCHPACAEPAMAQGERGRRLLRRGEACFAPATPCSICISCAPAPEDPRHQSRRAGTDHRVSGLWRPARARRHRKRLPCLRRHRAGRFPAMRPALCPAGRQLRTGPAGRAPVPPPDRARHQPLPATVADAGPHEHRRAHRQLPGRDLRADGRAWLFRARVHPENDTRGHRQLPGHGDRDGEPGVLAAAGRLPCCRSASAT